MNNKIAAVVMAYLCLLSVGCGRRVTHEYFVGPKGDTGSQGPAGPEGASCSVSTLEPSTELPNGGAVIQCPGSTVIVRNGANGAPGAAAPANEVIDPCGAQGDHDEVLIRGGSMVVASFSSNAAGDNTRFTVLKPGVGYITTDQTNCHFSINTDGSIND